MNKDLEMKVVSKTRLIPDSSQIREVIKSDKDLESIIQEIQRNNNLKILTLTNQSNETFSPELVANLILSISNCRSIEILGFTNFRNLFGKFIVNIIRSCASLPNLRTLGFIQTYIGREEGIIELINLLSHHTGLKRLILRDAAILPSMSNPIAKGLRKNTTLRELDLSDNPIAIGTGSSISRVIYKNKHSALCKLIFDCPETEVASELLYRDRVEKSWWDNSKDGKIDLQRLIEDADWLLGEARRRFKNREYDKYNSNVAEVINAKNYIANRLSMKISSIQDLKQAIQIISSRHQDLVEIILYTDQCLIIPTEVTKQLITAIKSCQNCFSLALQQFDNAFGELITQVIASLKNLPVLTRLDLSFTLLGKLGFEALCSWLDSNSVYIKLNLSHTGLYARESYEILADCLSSNRFVSKINISHNFIDRTRCELLRGAIENKDFLLKMDPEDSWYNYLVLLNKFIVKLPWDREKWDMRDGDPHVIKNAVEKMFSNDSFRLYFEETCQASLELQLASVARYAVNQRRDEQIKKFHKVKDRFLFFFASERELKDKKPDLRKDAQSVDWTSFYNDGSSLVSNSKYSYGTFKSF